MKIISMFGIFLSLAWLPILAYGYDIFVPSTLNEESVIFDSSIDLHGCQYHLKPMVCQNVPLQFALDKNTGLLQAWSSERETDSAKQEESLCKLSVVITRCNEVERVEIPVHVHMVQLRDLALSAAFSLESPDNVLNITVQETTQRTVPESSWVKSFPDKGLDHIIPASLLSCISKTHIMHSHSNSFVKRKLLYERGSKMVFLTQSIKHCQFTSNQDTIIPNQEVIVSIISSLPRDEFDGGALKRKKRGIRSSIAFHPRFVIAEISENLKSQTRVKPDLNLYNPNQIPVTFSWQPIQDKRSLDAFTLNPNTGVITTKKILDRENVPSHLFRVTAQGQGQSATCMLTINVKDMNDNIPRFEDQTYGFSIREDESVSAYVGKVTATDDDAGENKKIRYSIEGLNPPNVFSINSDGEITLGTELDRERTARYQFGVVATDCGTLPQRATASVTVTIDDINDVQPTFTRCPSVRIGEDTKSGTKITKVQATDPDDGDNGRVTYSLVSSQDRNSFSINGHTGEITLISDVSFERHPRGFRLRVRAQDGGNPPKSRYCEVLVNITDINDNAPKFISPPYETVVSEDLAIRSAVLQVKAVDPDAGENARITYSFVSPPRNLPFTINPNTGQIVLSRQLDYEKVTVYNLDVRAADHGLPQKSSIARVTIKIRDVNDNAPKFTRDLYRARISETAPVGEEIITVTARDPDHGSTLHYRIITGDPNNQFGLITRNKEGIITLAQKLDFNRRRSYLLSVLCSDGAKSTTTQVRINVTDANTNVPKFQRSTYEQSVDEDVAIGYLVLTVHATDDDDGENAVITYSLKNPSREFSLNAKSGEIRTKVKLDYDTNSQLPLTVIAKDNGIPRHQTEVLVTIYLNDVNDNAPVFDQTAYFARVDEDVKIESPVIRIHATDKDSGKNGQVWYTFQGGQDGDGYFSIDQSSGVIRTLLQLDREHVAEYELEAVAKDRGNPSRQTSVKVIVTVNDIDDNPPRFPSDELTFQVREDTPVGSPFARLHAVDPDIVGTSKVMYVITSVDNLNLWDLNPDTGELSPAFTLDYETQANYSILVSAYSNPLLSQVKVNINLVDVNDNPPVLNDFEIIFNNYRTRKPYTFPLGPIGKIPAHDPDVTSVLSYRFTAGNNNSLLFLNKTTGELRLSSKLDNDREFTATFMVEVTDGKYNVTGKCTLKVVPITDEMLTNSVTVRVQETSQEDFLSNGMKQFTHGLGQILNVTTQDVYIFNVQNDTDVSPHAVVNVSFSARRPAGSFFTTQHLQEQVYLNRSVLTNYSMQNVMPFDDNICLREPCENYMRCVSALYFNSSAPFVSTDTILFRPIHPVSGLRCKCPPGFAGLGCENEVNLCHPEKCKNGGKCISVEGGYVCECNGTFAGQHCEVNLVGSQCNEARDICMNGADCQPYPAGGFRCNCKQGGLVSEEVTRFCELRTRSFRKGDFIMFSGITRQWRFTLSLSFATQRKSGLLLYNGRFNHEHDYLALEIINGQVQLNFSTGQNYTVVNPYVEGGVSDGKWHTVEVEYRNKPMREIHGNGYTGPSNIKVVTVTIDPKTCDPAISADWHRRLGMHNCSKTAEQGGTKSSLDLTTPLLIGGVPSLPEAYQVHSRFFVGCIRDLRIDHRLVDMSTYVANHGSQPGCMALRDHCAKGPCSRRGTCRNAWGTYKCDCNSGHGGERCERIQPAYRLQGHGCLKHQHISQVPQFTTLPWTHTLSVRTTKPSGTILYIAAGTMVKIELSLEGGKVTYSIKIGRNSYRDQIDVEVNDGEWHEIRVSWKKTGSRICVGMSIDKDYGEDDFVVGNLPATFNRARITSLYLGGRWTSSHVENAFVGCIRGLEFHTQAGLTTVSEGNLTPTKGARYSKGCQVSDPCESNRCPTHSDCVSQFDNHTCRCHKGYVGKNCRSTCVVSPCQNSGTCRLSASEPYGYKCQCASKSFYGRICQKEHVLPCPSGWWGDLICTPCNCPVEKNFSPDCDDNGGKCKCKKNYFFSSEKEMCLPCNCYHIGSNGLECSDETGQCNCKQTVVGKKCNMCSSNFAEVQDGGCSVQYGMCPQVFVDGITWRRAEFGDTVLAQCPKDAVGRATRVCNEEKGWLKPMLGNCTGLHYRDLARDLENLGRAEYLREHRVRMSMDAVTKLYEASNKTEKLYQGDVLMSYKLIRKILETQNSLSGFDLTAARRKDFNRYLTDSTSHSLNADNLDHWKTLQRHVTKRETGPNAANSALLLQDYEEYVRTLTNNMKSMWYPSIVEIAPNIKLRIQPLSNEKDEEIDMAFDEGGKQLVSLTMLEPDSGDGKNLPKNGTVGVMLFSTLGQFLPMRFHDSRLDMRYPLKGFISSAVVSVVTHDRVNRSSRSNHDLITVTFTILQEGGSNPQCVFWNFTQRGDNEFGGWSQKGCSLKKSNKTHITCSCSHLTSFAVVSDEEVVSVLEELPVQIVMYASVAIILICIVVCLGFSFFLEDVKSNHSKIHNNFAISVFCSEICFAAGITQTANTYACMAVAIFIHFFFMSTLAWVFVEGLHLYRMLKEQRNVDRGNMRVYYLIGWGVPAMITALSVGLDAKGFGNANFCWIRTDHLLLWSFAGPLIVCAIVYVLIFCMTLGKYFTSRLTDSKRSDMRANLRSSFILLPVVGALWALALFAVNENKAPYYYLFSFVNIILGVLLLLLHCIFNKEVREAIRSVKERRWQRAELNTTKQHLLRTSMAQTPDVVDGSRRLRVGMSLSSTSTTNTANRRNNHQDSSMFHDMSDLDDDSDSDLSNSSMSLASTHSSDEDDIDEKPMTYLNVNNSNSWQYKNGHLPVRKSQGSPLVVHSTPKEKDIDNDLIPPAYAGSSSSSSRSDMYKTTLPTVEESTQEHEQNEEPHYLAINSLRKENSKPKEASKQKEDKVEMIPLQDMDSLPRKGILKNGRRSKPAPPPRKTGSLERTHSPLTTQDITDDASLLKKKDTLEKVAVIRNSPRPTEQDQLL